MIATTTCVLSVLVCLNPSRSSGCQCQWSTCSCTEHGCSSATSLPTVRQPRHVILDVRSFLAHMTASSEHSAIPMLAAAYWIRGFIRNTALCDRPFTVPARVDAAPPKKYFGFAFHQHCINAAPWKYIFTPTPQGLCTTSCGPQPPLKFMGIICKILCNAMNNSRSIQLKLSQ